MLLASHRDRPRTLVALKVLHERLHVAAGREAFQRECLTLARMEHSGVCRFVESGETEQGLPYLVMELLGGVDMVQFVDEHRVELRERLRLFDCLLDAVAHVHERGVLHLDLKSSNVLVDWELAVARVKLIDFGLAMFVGDVARAQGQWGLRGSLDSMAPERLGGKGCLDARADVYSLGVLLWQLVIGDRPFRGEERSVRRLQSDGLVALEARDYDLSAERWRGEGVELKAHMDAGLRGVLARCLATEPARRFLGVAELKLAIRESCDRAVQGTTTEASGFRGLRGQWAAIAAVFVCLLGAVVIVDGAGGARDRRPMVEAGPVVATVDRLETRRRLGGLVETIGQFGAGNLEELDRRIELFEAPSERTTPSYQRFVKRLFLELDSDESIAEPEARARIGELMIRSLGEEGVSDSVNGPLIGRYFRLLNGSGPELSDEIELDLGGASVERSLLEHPLLGGQVQARRAIQSGRWLRGSVHRLPELVADSSDFDSEDDVKPSGSAEPGAEADDGNSTDQDAEYERLGGFHFSSPGIWLGEVQLVRLDHSEDDGRPVSLWLWRFSVRGADGRDVARWYPYLVRYGDQVRTFELPEELRRVILLHGAGGQPRSVGLLGRG